MKAISEAISGTIIEDNGRHAVLLSEDAVETPPVYLIYALATLGPEEHVFPYIVLDDWGNEMKGLQVYDWIRENGNNFPRADVFAFGTDGKERQHFLREFELYVTYPVYAMSARNSPVESAVRIDAMLIADSSVSAATRIERPAKLSRPLEWARVSWWRVPPEQHELGFLKAKSEVS